MTEPRPPRFLSINTATALALLFGPAAYLNLEPAERAGTL